MRDFCTYFDHNYLAHGLALHHSLRRHCPGGFTLWVLCLSEPCRRALQRLDLPEVRPIAMEQFERDDPDLRACRSDRSRVEYYFTCSPSLPLYVFNQDPAVDLVTYLDADLYFFADPAPLFDEMAGQSVGIIEHRHAPHNRHLLAAGRFNVGWVSFRRDPSGLACLRWWRERCIECCSFDLAAGKVGDQKYLDEWPQRFGGVRVLQHPGANVAPWNVGNHAFTYDGVQVLVDGRPLIFFHFHGLKPIAGIIYDSGLTRYRTALPLVLRRRVYAPYVREMHEQAKGAASLLSEVEPDSAIQHQSATPPPSASGRRRAWVAALRLAGGLPRIAGISRRLLAGNYVAILRGRLF